MDSYIWSLYINSVQYSATATWIGCLSINFSGSLQGCQTQLHCFIIIYVTCMHAVSKHTPQVTTPCTKTGPVWLEPKKTSVGWTVPVCSMQWNSPCNTPTEYTGGLAALRNIKYGIGQAKLKGRQSNNIILTQIHSFFFTEFYRWLTKKEKCSLEFEFEMCSFTWEIWAVSLNVIMWEDGPVMEWGIVSQSELTHTHNTHTLVHTHTTL